jgi:hypothetical protein
MDEGMALSLFPTLAATIIGFIATSLQEKCVDIPIRKSSTVALIIVINQYTYN